MAKDRKLDVLPRRTNKGSRVTILMTCESAPPNDLMNFHRDPPFRGSTIS